MSDSTQTAPAGSPNMMTGLQIFQALDALFKLFLIFVSVVATWSVHRMWEFGAPSAWMIGVRVVVLLIVFNYAYLVTLLVVRLLIPAPREGVYQLDRKGLDSGVLLSCLNGLLTKARQEAPWPVFLAQNLTSIFPLRALMSRFFGPRSESVFPTETLILDPKLTTIGKNVTIGFGAVLTCHYHDNRMLHVKGIKVGDNVVIGGQTSIMCGVQIGANSMIAPRASVSPNTQIPPNEFWGGIPAKKIRSLDQTSPTNSPSSDV